MTKIEKPLPNQWLRQERERHGWSRAYLAEQLNVADPKTIGRWERGAAFPKAHFQRKLLELFELNAPDLGLLPRGDADLLPVHLAPLSPPQDACGQTVTVAQPTFWSLPFRRNLCFTGREEILSTLHTLLAIGQEIVPTQVVALSGLGGIGKTQLAIEYAYRYAQEYQSVFWIEAETTRSISASFVRIAEQLGLFECQEDDQAQIAAAVQRWLATHPGWLLIWDTVEDLDLLQRWLPSARGGALLFTTRHQALGTLARRIDLPTMTLEEGLLFLLRRAKVLLPEMSNEQIHSLSQGMLNDYQAARKLVAIMDGLPLALDQVGAYVEETTCRLEDYLQLYQVKQAELLKRRGNAVLDHPASVATTWSLTFEQVERASSVAADLLRLCAFLPADTISEDLFRQRTTLLGERLEPVASDPFQLHEAFRTISACSLLKYNARERTLSVHRLVQVVLREVMSTQEREIWQRRATCLLNAVCPDRTVCQQI